MSIKPIAPQDIVQAIPDAVIQIFNDLITANWRHPQGKAIIYQEEVVSRLVALGHPRDVIFRSGWLDVEHIYRLEGWKVSYDKPTYDEHGTPHFVFER